MSIAKGQTNCKAERNLVLQGFKEQLQVLSTSQIEQENLFNLELNEINTDKTLSDEEKLTLRCKWTNQIQDMEQYHSRIRNSVFIGLYSYWEVSLREIISEHISVFVNIVSSAKKLNNLSVKDCLELIYGVTLPSSVCIINNNLREFRNYMVHGNLTKKREVLINTLVNMHSEFCIKSVCRTYFVSEYKGLFKLLTFLSQELDRAENKIIEIKNNMVK